MKVMTPLSAARRRMRMTQAHLSKASGVSVRTIRRAERGSPITDEVARALCSVLGMAVTDLHVGNLSVETAAVLPRRYLHPGELAGRIFARAIYRWIGGLHPVLGYQIVLLPIWVRGDAYVLALMPMMMMASVLMLFRSARGSGCSRREAVEVLQGKRFVDGEPVDLDARSAGIAQGSGGKPCLDGLGAP